MSKSLSEFQQLIQTLESHYGRPKPPQVSEALHLILWENIGYLVDDERREAAFEALREQVGLRPTDILSASAEQLARITKLGGLHPGLRAHRLKEIAQITLNDFDNDLSNVLNLPLHEALKACKRFPSIGGPDAEKILLFTKTYPILALESNGLRVLLRLGFGQEHKNYSTSYRSVREAIKEETGNDCDFLIRAHQLLRRHGKEICRTNNPGCIACPVRVACRYYKNSRSRTQ
jgi:endonuclease-3